MNISYLSELEINMDMAFRLKLTKVNIIVGQFSFNLILSTSFMNPKLSREYSSTECIGPTYIFSIKVLIELISP